MDDFIKFVIGLLIIGVVAIVLGFLTSGFQNWDVTTWFDFDGLVSEGSDMFSGTSSIRI